MHAGNISGSDSTDTSGFLARASSSEQLPSNQRRFRDLLIFEERLRQNAAHHHRTLVYIQSILGALIVSICILAYLVFLAPPRNPTMHLLIKISLILTTTAVVLISYTEPLSRARRFIPQVNRALGRFNLRMTESRGDGGRLLFHRRIPRRLQEGYAGVRREYWDRRRSRGEA